MTLKYYNLKEEREREVIFKINKIIYLFQYFSMIFISSFIRSRYLHFISYTSNVTTSLILERHNDNIMYMYMCIALPSVLLHRPLLVGSSYV